MSDDLNTLSLADARDALRKGETTSAALTEACLKAIEDRKSTRLNSSH